MVIRGTRTSFLLDVCVHRLENGRTQSKYELLKHCRRTKSVNLHTPFYDSSCDTSGMAAKVSGSLGPDMPPVIDSLALAGKFRRFSCPRNCMSRMIPCHFLCCQWYTEQQSSVKSSFASMMEMLVPDTSHRTSNTTTGHPPLRFWEWGRYLRPIALHNSQCIASGVSYNKTPFGP